MQAFTHFLGRFELPVSQLEPPKETRILRKIDATFVQALKENIKRDPVGTGVPAAVVFTNQVKKAAFQEVLKDAYTYEVAGGLHGYTAKKELHEESPNPFFAAIDAIVYCDLTDKQALRLALRHNVNGHFVHKMTFRDLVSNKSYHFLFDSCFVVFFLTLFDTVLLGFLSGH